MYSPDHFIISIEGLTNEVFYKDKVKDKYDKKCRNCESDHNYESFRYYIFRLLVPNICNMALVYLEDDLKFVEFFDLLIGRKEGIYKEETVFVEEIVAKTESPFGHLLVPGSLTYIQQILARIVSFKIVTYSFICEFSAALFLHGFSQVNPKDIRSRSAEVLKEDGIEKRGYRVVFGYDFKWYAAFRKVGEVCLERLVFVVAIDVSISIFL